MTPLLEWLDDPRVFRVGKLAAHSDHEVYATQAAYLKQDNPLNLSLDGRWQFHYSATPAERTPEFYQPAAMARRQNFTTIQVPGHIQLQGHGQIQYINTLYPWEGQVYRRAPFINGDTTGQPGLFSAADDNPVGEYVTTFALPAAMQNKRIHLEFDGVEQAMYVWLNGHFVGYSEDSFSRAEFDLTPFIQAGENMLAVAVFKYSTAAFLEDQDMFRFSGIFRSVRLRALPDVTVTDLHLQPTIHESTGQLRAQVQVSAANQLDGKMQVAIYDAARTLIDMVVQPITATTMTVALTVPDVQRWSHHQPYLYHVAVTLLDEQAQEVVFVPYEIGFRTLTVTDQHEIQLNGQRLFLNGVNRHEWHPARGRAITLADMQRDIEIMQANHINAVRTSHYPNQVAWYTLADQAGIYVMAETNLESHGSWQKMGAIEPSVNVPGSHDAWREVVLDRAKSNYEQFKNHPAILFWSLGNESYAGDNIMLMDRYFKQQDASRLTHYEGVFRNRDYDDKMSDVESRMYATPAEIKAYLANEPTKPYLNCEFMHSMGNSVGGLDEYMALYDESVAYTGGFIWDYMDQALWQPDELTGEPVLKYGGDFNDRHSDYEFSGNGLLFADRQAKPAMQEVRYYYEKYDK